MDRIDPSPIADRLKIYPRSVEGTFTNYRWATVWLTQIVFYVLPWLQWNDRQAVLFDIEGRRFYLFNLILFPHDLIFLTALLIISALSLFLFTAVAGRLWCGFACPQTVYTEIFLWIEKKVEGDRNARIKLDQTSYAFERYSKKTIKHALWFLFSFWTGFTFVGYFTPINELWFAAWSLQLGPWQTFWIFFYGFATYGNAGFLREQICKFMCPYARFQSAMFDKDTLIVTYDEKRGEPRGRRAKTAILAEQKLGACIDCTLCVQVCPTGIDIRKGLQYECIGCGSCADGCDMVMDKVGYQRGLVRFTTQSGLQENLSSSQMLRRVFRPRIVAYSFALLFIIGLFITGLSLREPIRLDVLRDSNVLSRIVHQGHIENVYRLQLRNATESELELRLSVYGVPGLTVVSSTAFTLPATGTRSIPVTLRVPPGVEAGTHPIRFEVHVEHGSNWSVQQNSVFLVPR